MPRPASPGFHVRIDDRDLVALNYDNRQTVRLCRAAGDSTKADQLFEVPSERSLQWADLAHVGTLEQLLILLKSCDAARLTLRDPRITPVPARRGDPWLATAIPAIERSISQLLDEFVETPYLHRVEHSLHARLFELLKSEQTLQAKPSWECQGRAFTTQLVHKEWPETIARSNNRRGSFDLAILSPAQFTSETTLEHFRDGWIDAPIVIEVGLDYDWWHLAQDCLKLINSGTLAAYVVHLTRGPLSEEAVSMAESWILNPRSAARVAYAHFDPREGRVTRYSALGSSAVEER